MQKVFYEHGDYIDSENMPIFRCSVEGNHGVYSVVILTVYRIDAYRGLFQHIAGP